MTDTTHQYDEIEPMVPIMPQERTRTDGGRRRTRRQPRTPAAPLRTDYASEYTRDREEIEPIVPQFDD